MSLFGFELSKSSLLRRFVSLEKNMPRKGGGYRDADWITRQRSSSGFAIHVARGAVRLLFHRWRAQNDQGQTFATELQMDPVDGR